MLNRRIPPADKNSRTVSHFSEEFPKGCALIEPSPMFASFSNEKSTCQAVVNLPLALEVHFVSQMISSPRAALSAKFSKCVGASLRRREQRSCRKQSHTKARSSEGFVELRR